MVHVTGANGRYAVGDGEYGLTLMWRGVDTFFSVGQGEAALIESGMEFPATVEFMKNGFVRATLGGHAVQPVLPQHPRDARQVQGVRRRFGDGGD